MSLLHKEKNSMNYTREELKQLLGSIGENVTVHRSVQLFAPERIHIGSNVRIDCFAVLSAGPKGIWIGHNVHLGTGVSLLGSGGKLEIESFCGFSPRVTVFTASDDYSGGFMTNPTVPDRFRNVTAGDVRIERHAIVGSGSVLMPGITLGAASAVGALSFVNKNVPAFAIVSGNPLKLIGKRNEKILQLEKEFLG